jgi:rod shape determining protein RodA
MKQLGLTFAYLIPLVSLVLLSLLILNSVSPDSFRTQIGVLVFASLAVALLSRLDYQLYLFSPWPWYLLANLLLVFTFILGTVTRGSIRWIEIMGVSLQTSEFAKPLLILFIAAYLTRHLPSTLKDLAIFCGFMAVPTVLIYLQPDFGSALLILTITATSLIAAGVGFKPLAVVAAILILASPLVYLELKDYQRSRIQSFFKPNVDPLGTGYNALQATIAVGSGRIFGRGLGQGTQSHLRFLPERQTDFIFASLVEELGLVGGLLVIGSYTFLGYALLKTARSANTPVGSIICLVTLTLIFTQALVNIGMNMGLLPVTGITLPLVSAGGSSLFAFAIILGVCLSVAYHPSVTKPILEIR